MLIDSLPGLRPKTLLCFQASKQCSYQQVPDCQWGSHDLILERIRDPRSHDLILEISTASGDGMQMVQCKETFS